MKIKTKTSKAKGLICPKCNWKMNTLYQLSGWTKSDFLCANCFVEELKNSEADYQIIPKLELKQLENYQKAYIILGSYFNSISDEEKPKVDKQLKKLGL